MKRILFGNNVSRLICVRFIGADEQTKLEITNILENQFDRPMPTFNVVGHCLLKCEQCIEAVEIEVEDVEERR